MPNMVYLLTWLALAATGYFLVLTLYCYLSLNSVKQLPNAT